LCFRKNRLHEDESASSPMPHRADLEVLCGGARASCVASGRVPGDGLARVRGASGAVKSLLQRQRQRQPVRLPGSGR
jgi:hypothetical protein